MASATSVLSKTLQSITLTKIKELEKQRNSYETRKREVLAKAASCEDPRDRVTCLLDGVWELCPAAYRDPNVGNMERWLQQSRYDASIPVSTLDSFDSKLRKKLDTQSHKLSLADLYSRLLTEWMDPPSSFSSGKDTPSSDDASGDTFEMVERQKERLAGLVDKFESVVFEPYQTSESDISSFLDDLFPDDDAKKVLTTLRKRIARESKALMAESTPFNEESLARCIRGLLTEDLLSDEKQAILRDFLGNSVALGEIADVLNMRFTDLRQWQWDAGEEGIRVMPRQQLNGKYRIWADDDMLQMVFVQYIGIRLCNLLKSALKDFISDRSIWTWSQGAMESTPTQRDMDRRQYFTGVSLKPLSKKVVETERKNRYLDDFFLSQLPDGETSLYEGGNGGYDGDDDDEGFDEWKRPAGTHQKGPSIKQRLLRQLTSDMLIHRLRSVTYGKPLDSGKGVAILQTDLQWYGTSLPHSTVYAAMRYVGFTDDWVAFFKKYLEAPLNLDHSAEHRTPTGPRPRKRGVPMAHSSEKLIGELVLFFIDLTVNRQTGMLLHRLHDDIWLCGDPEDCARAWAGMQRFAEVFGLEFNSSKTGSVYLASEAKKDRKVAAVLPHGPVIIGFLKLNPESGDWDINQSQVDAHVWQLQKQLALCDSVLSWVQTWNSCIGRFFSHTFGEPAHCFGREHIDSTLQTYEKMQETIFGPGGNVVAHLKQMIRSRFQVDDPPDAFIFLPEHLGGLGVRNPFVSLFLVRDEISETPRQILEEFLERERDDHAHARRSFEATDEALLRRRLRAIYPDGRDERALDPGLRGFMPLAEYARFREAASPALHETYTRLLSVPELQGISLSKEVADALRRCGAAEGGRLEAEKRWIVQLYADELLETCGGISLVDKQFLPVGVLNMKRGKKVTWQMVL
ncbi:reverse transcriptase [Pleurostoma richardsiae]|uniref:Reverse transcriptase n=1 Tax=Pleurostoma richardsiae TaxID=41990 RepID=A0AA38VKJ7_9PEZI|nr:reverse transcriptase [Pleurostoma richardsiae]